MFRQRSVASLAVDMGMTAAFLFFKHVRVAVFARLVPGKVHGTGGDFGQSLSAKVPILSKTLRHKKGAHSQERQDTDGEHKRHPKEMSRIFEGIHKAALSDTAVGCQLAVRQITERRVFGYTQE